MKIFWELVATLFFSYAFEVEPTVDCYTAYFEKVSENSISVEKVNISTGIGNRTFGDRDPVVKESDRVLVRLLDKKGKILSELPQNLAAQQIMDARSPPTDSGLSKNAGMDSSYEKTLSGCLTYTKSAKTLVLVRLDKVVFSADLFQLFWDSSERFLKEENFKRKKIDGKVFAKVVSDGRSDKAIQIDEMLGDIEAQRQKQKPIGLISELKWFKNRVTSFSKK